MKHSSSSLLRFCYAIVWLFKTAYQDKKSLIQVLIVFTTWTFLFNVYIHLEELSEQSCLVIDWLNTSRHSRILLLVYPCLILLECFLPKCLSLPGPLHSALQNIHKTPQSCWSVDSAEKGNNLQPALLFLLCAGLRRRTVQPAGPVHPVEPNNVLHYFLLSVVYGPTLS